MRDIDKIVIHCSAGNIGNTAADIVHFHTGPKDKGCRGWKTPGYHYFVDKDGKVSRLVPEDRISNGVKGHNAHAINICYAGGVDQKTFSSHSSRTCFPDIRVPLSTGIGISQISRVHHSTLNPNMQIYETGDSTDNGLASPHGELPLSQGGAVRIAVLGVRILGHRSQVGQSYRPIGHTFIRPRHYPL